MKKTLKIFIKNHIVELSINQQIQAAIKSLSRGLLVAIPTETVYGLAAPLDNLEQVKKIFHLKQRPLFDPLIVHVNSIPMAKSLTNEWSKVHDILARFFWPGPLTLLARKNHVVNDLITSGLPMVGLRIPKNSLTLKLIKKTQTAFPAPSANLFKRTSPSRPEHVRNFFSKDDVHILNGGRCEVGIESTIVSIQLIPDQKKIILQIHRQGMITGTALKKCLRRFYSFPWMIDIELPSKNSHDATLGILPGTMEEHYRPICPFLLFISRQDFLTWKEQQSSEFFKTKNLVPLSLSSSSLMASREIYQAFHSIEQKKISHPILFLVLEDVLPSKIFYLYCQNFDSQKSKNHLSSQLVSVQINLQEQIDYEGWLAVIDRLYKASTKNLSSLV